MIVITYLWSAYMKFPLIQGEGENSCHMYCNKTGKLMIRGKCVHTSEL